MQNTNACNSSVLNSHIAHTYNFVQWFAKHSTKIENHSVSHSTLTLLSTSKHGIFSSFLSMFIIYVHHIIFCVVHEWVTPSQCAVIVFLLQILLKSHSLFQTFQVDCALRKHYTNAVCCSINSYEFNWCSEYAIFLLAIWRCWVI